MGREIVEGNDLADLSPYIRGFQLQDGLRTLKRSFDASHHALLADVCGAEEELAEHIEAIGDGVDPIGWTDGYSALTVGELLTLRLANAREAASELRAAFIIAIYHHWERCVYLWGGCRSSNHAAHLKVLEGLGYHPHPDLEKAYRLASLLKHNSARHGESVLTLWPDVFSLRFKRQPNADWYGGLNLIADHVDEVASIVAGSGPT